MSAPADTRASIPIVPTQRDAGTRRTVGRIGWRRGRPKTGTFLLALGAAFFTLLIAVPILAIFVRVLPRGAFWAAATRPVVLEALRLSFETTLLTLVLSVVLGTPLAYLLARYRFPGQTLVDSLIELPMVLPPAVA